MLACAQVLISEDGVGKLADVGSSQRLKDTHMPREVRTEGYEPPEQAKTNEKCDIYSFGVMIWVVYTGCDPEFRCHTPSRAQVIADLTDNHRSSPVYGLLMGGESSTHLGALANAGNMQHRPSAIQLVAALR